MLYDIFLTIQFADDHKLVMNPRQVSLIVNVSNLSCSTLSDLGIFHQVLGIMFELVSSIRILVVFGQII